jgi:hypothetical protein
MKSSTFTRLNPFRKKRNYLDADKLDSQGHLLHLFTTPFYVAKEDPKTSIFHNAMKEMLLKRHESLERGIVAHWAEQDLFDWPLPEVKAFKTFLHQHFKHRVALEFGLPTAEKAVYDWVAWANVKTTADWHGFHYHAGAMLSFVYYVSCEGGDSGYKSLLRPDYNGDFFGGMIQFIDPRGAAPYMSTEPFYAAVEDSRFYIEPQEGVLTIFPSYLGHMVAPITSTYPRVSIAGNFKDIRIKVEAQPNPTKKKEHGPNP